MFFPAAVTRQFAILILLTTLALTAACTSSQCESNADCFEGEVCNIGACQPESIVTDDTDLDAGNLPDAEEDANDADLDATSPDVDEDANANTDVEDADATDTEDAEDPHADAVIADADVSEDPEDPDADVSEDPEPTITAIAAGTFHTCAIYDEALYCWGRNSHGQLGQPSNEAGFYHTPTLVAGLESGVSAVAAGSDFTCAVQDGALLCFGKGGLGQLGRGEAVDSNSANPTPTPVVGLESGVSAVAAGSIHACVIQNGALKCFGYNGLGALGDARTAGESNPDAITPTPITAEGLDAGVTLVSAGGHHTCALHNGVVKCFGNNSQGQLGHDQNLGQDTHNPTPTAIAGLTDVTLLEGGEYTTCAIASGAARCWGHNYYGQAGHPDNFDTLGVQDHTLHTVEGFAASATDLSSGRQHTCAVKDAIVYCFGANNSGRCGHDGDSTYQPIALSTLTDVSLIASGNIHSCALAGGQLYCWGNATYGQTGATTSSHIPNLVTFP
ncbi:RCC1 domain-containing protein [Lujinxingia vulgaris]|nr:RCC1 domain-containing protein [Lujinxingia vulgaris]